MFELTGTLAMAQEIIAAGQTISAKAGYALLNEGHRIMNRSKAEFVPILTGALRDSGKVTQEKVGNQWEVALIYGGGVVTYALEQHETPHYHHPVGQWKYLETPLLEASSGMAGRVAADMAF